MSKLFRVQRVTNKKTGRTYTYQYQYEEVNGKLQRKSKKILVTKAGKINRKNVNKVIEEIDDLIADSGKYSHQRLVEEINNYVEARSKLNKNTMFKWDKHRITETSIVTHLINVVKKDMMKEYKTNSLDVFLLNAGVTKEYLAKKYNLKEEDINDKNINNGILTVVDKNGLLRKFIVQFDYNNDAVLIEI